MNAQSPCPPGRLRIPQIADGDLVSGTGDLPDEPQYLVGGRFTVPVYFHLTLARQWTGPTVTLAGRRSR